MQFIQFQIFNQPNKVETYSADMNKRKEKTK